MTIPHDFIFKPGFWIGEGRITFSISSRHAHFYTRWEIEKEEKKSIVCHQHVETGNSQVRNMFIISEILPTSFHIELKNETLGTIHGKGIIDAKTIAWEFRGHLEFEGFEVYTLQEGGDFMLHAEYVSSDQIRTIIDGRIWKKERL